MLSLSNKLSLTTQPVYKFVNKYSIDFDGVDDRIITDGEVVQYQHATYSFWCKASETGQNKGIFGNGDVKQGSFNFNWNADRPLLYLGTNYYQMWNDTPAQDDGEWHHWVVYVCKSDITKSKLWVDAVLINKNFGDNSGSVSTYTESLTIGSDQQSGGNSFVGKIDEFAVYDRELTQAEITRMYNTYYSPNRIANGNFAQIGNEEVTNGDFSQIGSEQVTNGDFATDSDWNMAGGTFEITNGKLHCISDGSYQYAGQGGVFVVGKTYKVTFDIVDYTSGSIRVRPSGQSPFNTYNANGTYTQYITATNTTLVIERNSACDLFVDNVSVKEVLQDWTVSDYGGIAASASLSLDNGAVKILKTADSDWRSSFLRQTITYTNTKFYKVSFKIKDGNTTGANIYVRHDYDTGSRTIASGISLTSSFVEYTYYFQAESNSTDISFGNLSWNSAGSGEYFFVDDVTIKEVGQHWTFGTDWKFDGDKPYRDTTGTSPLYQSAGLIIGRTYKVTFDLVSVTASGIRPYVGGAGTGTLRTSVGTYSENIVCAGNNIFYMQQENDFIGSIDNIVLQELKHDATNLMLNAGDYQSANPLITSTKSMEFDGVDDYLTVSDNSSLDFAAGFSVSFWVYPHAADANDRMVCKGVTGTGEWMISFGSGQAIRVYTQDGDSVVKDFTSTNTLTLNEWAMVTVVVNRTSNKLQVYKNGGNLDESSASWTSGWSNSAALTMGVNSSQAGDFDGRMTEVGIWNRELTSLEVASLYNQGVPTDLLVSRGDYVATGLQGYWKMGDGTNDEYPYIFDQTNPTYSSDLISTLQNGRTGGTNAFEEFTDNGGGSYTFGSTSTNWAGTEQPDADTFAIEVGEIYKFTFDYTLNSGSSSFGLSIGNTAVGSSYAGGYYYPSYNGSHTVYFTIQTANSSSRIISQTNAIQNFTISNLVLQKLEGNIATMTNMLEGNITNQYPLTKIRNYYRMGDGILDNYPLIADQTNPSLSNELVTNGDFATDSNWTKGTGWSINTSSKIAECDGTQSTFSYLTQSGLGVSDKLYEIKFSVTRSAGTLRPQFVGGSSGVSGSDITSSGEYTIYMQPVDNTTLRFRANSSFVGSIDNVSVKQVNGSPGIMTNMSASDIILDTPNEPN
jgi:hypothetical protein